VSRSTFFLGAAVMSTRAVGRVGRVGTRSRSPLAWGVVAGAAAVGTGVAAAFNPEIALMLLIMAALGIAVVLHPPALLFILIISVLIEAITVGDITVSRLLAPLALLVTAATLLRGKARLNLAPPLWWVVGYLVWALASALWSVNFDATAFQLGGLAIGASYMLAFAVLLDNERDLRRTIIALAIGGLVIGAYAMYSFIVGGVYRADPATGDSSFFATYQIIAIPILLAYSSIVRSREARLALYVVIAVLIGSVMTSLARTGAVALVVVALLLLVMPSKAIFRSGRQKLLAFVLIIAGGALVFSATSATVLPRFETIFASGETGSGRTNIWKGAVTSIGERPLLGVGAGGFPTVSNELMLRTQGVDFSAYDLRPDGAAVHNTFLGALAELGIPGFILFVGMLVSTGRHLRKMSRRANRQGAVFLRRFSNALLIGLVCWAVAANFLSAETSRPIWILIGFALALPKLLDAARATAPEPMESSIDVAVPRPGPAAG
jgi:O-antigen ligase